MKKNPNLPENNADLTGSERPAFAGRLTPSDAHDFKNIHAVIKLYAQLGLRNPTVNEELKEHFRTILEQSAAANQLIDKIMGTSNHQSSEK